MTSAAARIRRSSLFMAVTLAGCALLGLCFAHARRAGLTAGPAVARRAAIVRALGLTDLCLFTDASYTRHLALSDRHAPFQEHPVSLEHFPAGSIVSPPDRPGR